MERKMETVKKINVLGTQYTLIINADDELLPENADGAMDHSLKRIVIAEFDKPDRNTIKDLSVYRKKVIRHEIIHAFLYESGLWNNSGDVSAWGQSEEITDWFAIQSPKIFKAFQETGCI